jgi:predicted NUDIX family phosphoesterase
MSGKFLRAAYRVLDGAQKPLDAVQLVNLACEAGFLHTMGKTPNNTMRARLSDDVRELGGKSLFQRVGPNRFGLREWDFAEYHARPFTRALPNETTVCVPGTIQQAIAPSALWYSPISAELLAYLGKPTNLSFVDRQTAETTSRYKQLIAYVWLETTDGRVLSYTRGKYSSAHRTLLLGRRSVGFGGHVLKEDAESIFGSADAGLQEAAIREAVEELGVEPTSLQPVGVIWDDSSYEGQKHIGVVMRGMVPASEKLPQRAEERSINGLQLLNKTQLWEQFHAMEFWSQLVIQQFAAEARPTNISSVVPPRRPPGMGHLAFVGEIANGKSSLASALAKDLGFQVVSASAVLRRILGVAHADERNRPAFQAQALAFIRADGGPSQLALEIASEVSTGRGPAIIDGIRQLATLEALRALLPNLVVLYIDAPRDVAYNNYRTRLPSATVLDFAAVREHEVEAELPLFRFEADAVLNNADSKVHTLSALRAWIRSSHR